MPKAKGKTFTCDKCKRNRKYHSLWKLKSKGEINGICTQCLGKLNKTNINMK